MMKLLLTFFLGIIIYPCYSQKTEGPLQITINTALVAKNTRRTRIYRNGALVKIFYRNPAGIKKIKGRLFVLKDGRIQVAPFGKKQIITINLPDVASVGIWARQDKIAAAVIGGTGLLALGGALLSEPEVRPGVADGNIIGFFFVIYAVAILWVEAFYVPYIYIKELINKSSEKKGYHFFLEKAPQKNGTSFNIF